MESATIKTPLAPASAGSAFRQNPIFLKDQNMGKKTQTSVAFLVIAAVVAVVAVLSVWILYVQPTTLQSFRTISSFPGLKQYLAAE